MALPLRIKICGVTTAHDARQAALLGADAVGLNFHPGSPRYLDPAAAPDVLRALPVFVEPVGVFVNRTMRQIFEQIQPLQRIRTVQWHGQDREVVDCYPLHYISAFAVRDADSLRGIVRYMETCRGMGRLPSAVLVDAYVRGKHGGTSQTAPWHLLAGFRPGVPMLLAGGLTPDNVADAIRIVQPYGVDVASGVESAPGVKDADKMRAFIDRAREAAAGL
jgi:phosphoribosylanthranilate isomerase